MLYESIKNGVTCKAVTPSAISFVLTCIDRRALLTVLQYRQDQGSSFTEYRRLLKDEKLHTAGLNDTATLHIKMKITEKPLEKKLNTAIQ